ncbi:Nmad2 family putative nucleotide modification protein [Crocinitomix algicola]|uniref:Nmad2 family putative nucleotide modification protein n=1 Tax=Crocinitomix algicola TaxID=1740263 RepID=UPI0008722875|nr:hypothetical protein [Crocinitomix algicola]
MKIYSYVVHHDFGLAPNPFGKYCTLTVCKPKIRKSSNLEIGDWIIGTGSKNIEDTTGFKCLNRLIYAMKVSEKIPMEDYWNAPRFQYKKPVVNGSLVAMYGDNIYYKNSDNDWCQVNSAHSLDHGQRNEGHLDTDVGGKYALVSEEFFYFGDSAPIIPEEFSDFIKPGVGEKKITDEKETLKFVQWLESNFDTGINGDPINWREYQQTEIIIE